MRRATAAVATIATYALACATSTQAHHSLGMFEIGTPVWLKGTVVSHDVVNPHTMIVLEETDATGEARRWTVEGPGLARLGRMKLGQGFIVPGDVIEVCGFRYKENIERIPPLRVHGHMVVTSRGQLQPWGPYGKFDNCVRPSDSSDTWARLLNSDAIAHDLWCQPHRAAAPTLASIQALVAQIDERLEVPCR